jgi:TolB-like protein
MSFLQELKRRNVTKVAVLYVVAAWLILQAAELLFDAMNVSDELLRFVIAILVLGFPLVLIFSWVFELTPEGVKREKDIDRDASITPQTGQRINTVIVVLLVVAVATVAVDRLIPEQAGEPIASDTAEPVAAVDREPIEEPVAAENSIGVLPFTDLSAEGDQEYFSDGIAEEILNVLVRVEGLQVASRTTSFGLKGQESLGMPVLAEKMKVRHVLEGSVRKAGDTVRITAQLIDAQSNMHLWSETYDRQLTAESIFEIQDEIAGAIVEQLGVLMGTGTAPPRIVADTQDLEAYEVYLQAHQLFIERALIEDINRSIALFEQAVAIDPKFARAWAGLAGAYVVAPSWYLADRDYYELAKKAADTAIELNPDIALSYAVIAYVQQVQPAPGWEQSRQNYDRALQLDNKSSTALMWRGSLWLELGYFDRAEDDFLACLKIDPAYDNCRRWLSAVKVFTRDFDAALELYETGFLSGHTVFGAGAEGEFMMLAKGHRLAVIASSSDYYGQQGAIELLEPIIEAMSNREFEFEDKRASVEAIYRSALGEELDWNNDPYMSLYFKNYEAIARTDDAPFYWYPYPEDFKHSPHPKRMIRDLGVFAYWQKHGFPSQCRAVGDNDFECD